MGPNPDDPPMTSTVLRIEDLVINSQNNRDIWWDFVASGVQQKLYINNQSSSSPGVTNLMTLTESGYVGFMNVNPKATLDVYGHVFIGNGNKAAVIYFPNQVEQGSDLPNLYFRSDDSPETYEASSERMFIGGNGNIGVGTIDPQAKLHIDLSSLNNVTSAIEVTKNGQSIFRLQENGELLVESIKSNEVEVKINIWQDAVLRPNYSLIDLDSLEVFINKYNHLPDVPAESEVLQGGINLGEMSGILLKKIEELTLYIIELNKEVNDLKSENNGLLKRIESIENAKP